MATIVSQTKEYRFKCGKCETGIVRVIEKRGKVANTLSCKPCDNRKCKEGYGLLRVYDLEEIV